MLEVIDIMDVARSQGIRVKHYNFSDIDGICTRRGENQYIGIRYGMSEIQKRETIAHEMGHLLDGTEDIVHIRYAEWSAEKKGRELLIPYEKLIKAIEENDGICDSYMMAIQFGVSPEMMQERIKDIFNL